MVGQNPSPMKGKGPVGQMKGDQKPKDEGPDQKKGKPNPPRNDQRKRGPPGGWQGHRNQHNQGNQEHGHDSTSQDDKVDAPPAEKKFTGRCRLFVGNLPNDTKEEDFRALFKPYGELSEVYVNTQRGFGFVRLDTRPNAEAAKAGLDGLQKKGRVLRVRFATHGAALRVKHLDPYISNELLADAFSQFGQIERAVVIVDDRGKPTGEGIVEFARKPGAQQALSRINDGVFIMGATCRPIVVEPLDQKDEEDGLPEKFINKNAHFLKERDQPPRFASPGSFEYEFAQKWKELYIMEEKQKLQLQRQIEEQHAKLEMEMGQAQIEHQAILLRQEYMRKQEDLKRMEEMHQQEIQRRLEMNRRQMERLREADDLRRDDDRRRQEMVARRQQEEELRRRQMEGGRGGDMFGNQGPAGGRFNDDGPSGMRDMRERNAPPMQPPPAPPAGLGIDRPRNHGGMGGGQGNQGGGGGGSGPNGMGHGGQGSGMSGQQPMRQSRFDQPPSQMGGRFGGGSGMGGGGGGGSGSGSGMGGESRGNMMGGNGGNQMMGGGSGGGGSGMGRRPMGGQEGGRGMMQEGRGRPQQDDDFYESKRPRRY